MKKSILVILTLVLLSIMAYAEPPVKPVCGDGVCNATETCSSCPADCGVCPTLEIIPKVIDANGKVVGHVLSADTGADKTVVLGMEFNGKKFKAKMTNGQFDPGPDIFYDSTDCSGTGYVQFDSAESIMINCLCAGLFIGNMVYLPVYGGYTPVRERTASSKRSSIGQCTSSYYRVYWAYPYQPAFDWRVEFLPPFKMVSLSGGQRQRIAIARAFLTDPRILILDDSTSAIDSATEDQIQRAMRQISRQRTTFLITHRLSQIRWANHILVLRRGELVDQGTHEELMGRSLDYQKIFARYE